MMKFGNIALNINTKCNFRCDYCFIPHETKEGNEIGYDTLNEFRRFCLHYGEKKLSVDVFGVEPLISWDKLVYLINMAEVYGWKVGVTTNGSLVTKARAEFLVEKNVGLLVSYDGSRKSHNRFRKFKSGQGTWAKVCDGISHLQEAGARYACAMVVSPENLPYLMHNVKSASSRGFEFIALNPQFTTGESKHEKGYDWEILRRKYRQAAEWAIANEVMLKFTMEAMYSYGKEGLKSPSNATCGACKGSIAIDWDGQAYICHRACGREEFRIGDMDNGLVEEIVNSYRMRDINECHVCPLFHQRGSCGHCWTIAKDITGDMRRLPDEVCLWMNIINDVDMDLYREYSVSAVNSSVLKDKSFTIQKTI